MNSDSRLSGLEEDLRRDAERLHALQPPVIPLRQLQTGYHRGRRRRMVRRVTALVAPVLVMAAVLPVFYGRSADKPAKELSTERSIAPIEPRALDVSAERGAADARDVAAAALVEASGVIAIPVVIIRDEDGQPSVMPGILVPAHEIPVPIFDLSPAEQQAVRRVLGPEGQGDLHEAI
jgi:hypothetical protein